MSETAGTREHDIVVFGATGFVGKLTAAYLAGAAPAGTKIALGGRSQEKLERTRAELGARAAGWPLVVADSHDAGGAGQALAESTTVVATTVGPYLKYGLPLVEACAAAGTHYADLTGETLFMRRSIDAADAAAKASGARIVHTCGFDSIPSDLGVFLLARARAGHRRRRPRGDDAGRPRDARRRQRRHDRLDARLGRRGPGRQGRAPKVMADPYALSPDRAAEPDLGNERDPMGPIRDERARRLAGAVRHGHGQHARGAAQQRAAGPRLRARLRYRELMLTGGLPLGPVKAAGISAGLGALFAGLALTPTRKLLDRVLPDPGEGPSERARDAGFFKIDTHARTSTGAHLVCRIAARATPATRRPR